MDEAILKAVAAMRHSPIRNYIIPGVTSWMVGRGDLGKIRMFTIDRDTREWVTPHSHRFDFTCVVLKGSATNILFHRTFRSDQGNAYVTGEMKVTDGFGKYEYTPGTEPGYWSETTSIYGVGETYSMRSHEIHSIQFSRGSVILFFEGPEVTDTSYVLEPWSDDRRVPTFETRSWMFDRSADSATENVSTTGESK